jgi:hypothetical protein
LGGGLQRGVAAGRELDDNLLECRKKKRVKPTEVG